MKQIPDTPTLPALLTEERAKGWRELVLKMVLVRFLSVFQSQDLTLGKHNINP